MTDSVHPHTSALGCTWEGALRRLAWAISDEPLVEIACPICRGRGYFDKWFQDPFGDPVARLAKLKPTPTPSLRGRKKIDAEQDPVDILYVQREECWCYRSPAKMVGRLALSPLTAARLYITGWTRLRAPIAVMADLLASRGDRTSLWLHALIERPNAQGRYPVREATDGELALLIAWRMEEDARRAKAVHENYMLATASNYMASRHDDVLDGLVAWLDDDLSDAVERLKRRLAAAQEQAEPPADISAPEAQRFGPVGSSLRRRLSRGRR